MEAVVKSELFSLSDFSETVKEDLPADSAHRQIRLTTRIDEFRTTPAHGSIEQRPPIQANNVNAPRFPSQELFYGTAHHFLPADPCARVLDDLFPFRDRFFGEHTKPFDPRPTDAELKRGHFR